MRKMTKRMAREICAMTRKYQYYINTEKGGVYRLPVKC